MKIFTVLFFALGLFIPSASQKFKTYIVKIEEGSVQEGKTLLNNLKNRTHIKKWKYLAAVKDALMTGNAVAVTNLTASDAVKSVEVDTAMGLLNTTDEGGQGRIRRRNRNLVGYTPEAIAETHAADIPKLPSETKKICIVDSGYDIGNSHMPTLEKGNGLNSTNGYSSYESNLWSDDVNGHGTRMASLLVGTGQSGTLIRGIMNQNSDDNFDDFVFDNFVIAKAAEDDGTSTASHVIDAMNSCAERNADVIILSVTSQTFSQAFADAVKVLFEEKDCLLLAPTGGSKDTSKASMFPAAYPHVISVGAVDDYMESKDYSLPNTQNEIMAFGVRLATGNTFGDEEFLTGTSVAVPLVAGSAALIWSHFPDCSPMQVRYALARTAHREYPYGNGDCTMQKGHGIVNAKDAYDYLEAHPCTGAGSIDKWNKKYRNKSIVESGNCFGTVEQTSSSSSSSFSSSSVSSKSFSSQSSNSTEGCEGWCPIVTVPWKPASAGALAKCDWTDYCDKCPQCSCKSWCSAIPETDIPWNATSTGGLSKCGTFESFCAGCEEC